MESNCSILSSTQRMPLEYRTRILSSLKDMKLTILRALLLCTTYGLLNGNKHRELICSVNSQAPREKLPIETQDTLAFSSS